jgi:hypothetical protein
MEVTGQLHAPVAVHPEDRDAVVTIGQEAEWTQIMSGRSGEDKIPAPTGIQTLVVQLSADHFVVKAAKL